MVMVVEEMKATTVQQVAVDECAAALDLLRHTGVSQSELEDMFEQGVLYDDDNAAATAWAGKEKVQWNGNCIWETTPSHERIMDIMSIQHLKAWEAIFQN